MPYAEGKVSFELNYHREKLRPRNPQRDEIYRQKWYQIMYSDPTNKDYNEYCLYRPTLDRFLKFIDADRERKRIWQVARERRQEGNPDASCLFRSANKYRGDRPFLRHPGDFTPREIENATRRASSCEIHFWSKLSEWFLLEHAPKMDRTELYGWMSHLCSLSIERLVSQDHGDFKIIYPCGATQGFWGSDLLRQCSAAKRPDLYEYSPIGLLWLNGIAAHMGARVDGLVEGSETELHVNIGAGVHPDSVEVNPCPGSALEAFIVSEPREGGAPINPTASKMVGKDVYGMAFVLMPGSIRHHPKLDHVMGRFSTYYWKIG